MPDQAGEELRAAETTARAALAGDPATAGLAGARFTPIAGSLNNFAWRATTSAEERFVRLARTGTERLGADLEAEATVLRCVPAAGLAPPVIRCDPPSRLLVTQWVPSAGSPPAPSSNRAIVAVAHALQRLHALAPPAGLRRVDFRQQSRGLPGVPSLPTTGAALAQAADEIFARLDAAAQPLVLCHHDVHAQNMLFDRAGRLWLVDWEYAGLGDPVFDLASYACQQQLDATAASSLVQEYVGAGGSATVERLVDARWVFDYVQMLWYRGLDAIGPAAAGQSEAQARAARLEADLMARASGVLRCNNGRFGHND